MMPFFTVAPTAPGTAALHAYQVVVRTIGGTSRRG
jgi:hypothetical protein